jgi:hypothetical protein
MFSNNESYVLSSPGTGQSGNFKRPNFLKTSDMDEEEGD